MKTYPITIPAGCPSYVSDSVQTQCSGIFNRALAGESAASLNKAVSAKHREELFVLRRHLDAEPVIPDGPAGWWLKWGYRTVTKAWEDAAELAAFREALANPNVSHVTDGHTVSPNYYHVYGRDPSSPSGCYLIGSAAHDLPGVAEVLEASGRRTCQGAQRGEMAARRAMMGRV